MINKQFILSISIVFSLPSCLSAMSVAHPYENSHFSNEVHLYRNAHRRTLSQQENSAKQDSTDAIVSKPKPKSFPSSFHSEAEKKARQVVSIKDHECSAHDDSCSTTVHCAAMLYQYK